MDAVKYGAAVLYRARASTDSGDVHLESRHEDAVRIAVQVVNEHDSLLAQRDALVAALKPFAALADEIEQNPLGSARYAFDDTSLEVADCIAARTALALVKSDDATA